MTQYPHSDIQKHYENIKAIFKTLDPFDLIQGGAPKDEYDSLAIRVFTSLVKNIDKKDVLNVELYTKLTSFLKEIDDPDAVDPKIMELLTFNIREELIDYYLN